MIRAVIFEDNQGSLIGFEISGHARFADSGKDIVCAAVSILSTTTVNSLEEQLVGKKPIYRVDEDKGSLKCIVSSGLDNPDMEKAQIILKTLVIGLKSIEQEYGKYLKLQQRRWTQC